MKEIEKIEWWNKEIGGVHLISYSNSFQKKKKKKKKRLRREGEKERRREGEKEREEKIPKGEVLALDLPSKKP